MNPADQRVTELVDKWLASLELHVKYLSLTDEAYWQVQPWAPHQRPARWILDIALTRARELKNLIDERIAAGDSGFAEGLELMVFLANLVGVQNIERFIPLAEAERENREALGQTNSKLSPLTNTSTQTRTLLEPTREMRAPDAPPAPVSAPPPATPRPAPVATPAPSKPAAPLTPPTPAPRPAAPSPPSPEAARPAPQPAPAPGSSRPVAPSVPAPATARPVTPSTPAPAPARSAASATAEHGSARPAAPPSPPAPAATGARAAKPATTPAAAAPARPAAGTGRHGHRKDTARSGSQRQPRVPDPGSAEAQVFADAVRLLKWGRQWHELPEAIARTAGRPGVVEVRKMLRSFKSEIEKAAAG